MDSHGIRNNSNLVNLIEGNFTEEWAEKGLENNS